MHEDRERCLRAVRSKDARFDGWFFTAVTTTRIYCRPSCPVVPPKPQNMRFYPSAAAAQQAGFRACKRCRPDATPGSPEWDLRADAAARAVRLIADGVIDREGVPGLARRLGYSVRQVQRLLLSELGAGPLALARAQRAQTARTLVETTTLPMTEVAFAAGFSSVRSFNDTVRATFGATPSELRRRRTATTGAGASGARSPAPRSAGGPRDRGPLGRLGPLEVRLPFRRPFEPSNLFGHLVATAVPGVEEWRDGAYRRTLRLPHGHAVVALRPSDGHVACRLHLSDLRDLASAIARCRRLLDLDADPEAVDELLTADAALTGVVGSAPGRRVPRTVDSAELAVRAVLGQQVSTAGARTTTARLVVALGEPLDDPDGGLTHLFPEPAHLAELAPEAWGVPAGRAQAARALAEALATGDVDLGPGADRDRARAQLLALPGIGPWTVEVIAMRALGDPDAFPVTDLGVRRGAATLGLPDAPAALERRSAAWRPWRAYAVQHLWAATPHPVNHLPPTQPEDRCATTP